LGLKTLLPCKASDPRLKVCRDHRVRCSIKKFTSIKPCDDIVRSLLRVADSRQNFGQFAQLVAAYLDVLIRCPERMTEGRYQQSPEESQN
jgi:hypothetical protein